jgi:hypothetical protein
MRKISSTIKGLKDHLYSMGIVRPSKLWQGVDIGHSLYEVFNCYISMEVPHHVKELADETEADLPWAEDHFKERIAGKPLNPGNEYKNWPYYRAMDNDALFRGHEEKKFSHTYMERFWPPKIKGIRYEMGDFNDFLEKFKQDPHGRQNYFSIWHPEDQSPGTRRLPCTLGYYFQVIQNDLYCTYHIRSCDIFRHFKNDIYMAVRLMHYTHSQIQSIIPGLGLGNLDMWIGSLHCFEVEKEMLKQ